MQTKTTQPGRIRRGLLWVAQGALALVFAGGSLAAQNAAIRDVSTSWTLSDGQVIETGETATLPNGTLLSGYVIEAAAESDDSPLIAKGTLRIDLTAFSPKKDGPRQKAGVWYIRGKWSLTDTQAPPSGNPRFTPGAFDGLLRFEQPSNPASNPGNWSATLQLPQTLLEPVAKGQGRQPLRGKGALTFDSRLNGTLTLDLKLWPRVNPGQGR